MEISVDIGNTFTKIGVFEQGFLKDKFKFKSEDVDAVFDKIIEYPDRKIIFSSIKSIDERYEKLAASSHYYLLLSHLTPLPIEIDYNTPETLGRDRIAGVMGAYKCFPNKNVLVIDAGTCITYDVLTKEGVYLGGNIAPGIEMRQRAMNHYTAALPHVKTTWNIQMLGKTTEEALQNGSLKGIVYEINGFIHALGQELDNFGVVLTGGNAKLLSKYVDGDIIVNNDLILMGLNEIIKFNVS